MIYIIRGPIFIIALQDCSIIPLSFTKDNVPPEIFGLS